MDEPFLSKKWWKAIFASCVIKILFHFSFLFGLNIPIIILIVSLELSATEEQIKDFRLKLGDKIRIVREKKGYSQEQLAEKMDINRSTISKIENGKFGITVDYLVRFSIFLDYEFKVIERWITN